MLEKYAAVQEGSINEQGMGTGLEILGHDDFQEYMESEMGEVPATDQTEYKSKDVPYIFCEWSESAVFKGKTAYSIAEFDRLIKEADTTHAAKKEEGIKKYGSWQAMYDLDDPEYTPFLGYDKVKFTLVMPDGRMFTERQDIGDGDGGVVDFLRSSDIYREISYPAGHYPARTGIRTRRTSNP